MGEIATSKGFTVFQTPEGVTEIRLSDDTVVLSTQVKGGVLSFRDYNGRFWAFTDILSIVFEHYPFPPHELQNLLTTLRAEGAYTLRKLLTNAILGASTLPYAERQLAKKVLGVIEDERGLEIRRTQERIQLNAFLAPFHASAEPGLLSASIAEHNERYQRRVAGDMCGYKGNCLWWLPACSDTWQFWRQLGWRSPTSDEVRELDPENTQEGSWVLWTPVIHSGVTENILQKIRAAMELRSYQWPERVHNATPSQLLYLLRRAEHQSHRLPLREDEVLLTSAERGWWCKEQVRIRQAPKSTIEMAAIDTTYPDSTELPYRILAEHMEDPSSTTNPVLTPLELLLDKDPPPNYVEGIMPLFFVK